MTAAADIAGACGASFISGGLVALVSMLRSRRKSRAHQDERLDRIQEGLFGRPERDGFPEVKGLYQYAHDNQHATREALAGATKGFEAVQVQLKDIAEHTSPLGGRLDTIERVQNENLPRLTQAVHDLAQVTGQLAEVTDKLSSVTERVDGLEDRVGQLEKLDQRAS